MVKKGGKNVKKGGKNVKKCSNGGKRGNLDYSLIRVG